MTAPVFRDEPDPTSERAMRSSRALARALWIGLVATSLLGIGAMSWFASQFRLEMVETSAASLRNVVLTVERYLSTRLETTDTLLKIALVETAGPSLVASPRVLELAAGANPALRRLSVIEIETGRQIYGWSRDPALGTKRFGSEDTLPSFRRDAGLMLRVGEPVLSGPQGETFSTLARRGEGRDAGLLGMAELDLTPLQKLLDAIEVPGEGSLSVYRKDGVTILRTARNGSVMADSFTPAALLRELERQPPSAVLSARTPDGVEFLVARAPLVDMPLVVVAAAAADQVLAGWRRDLLRQLAPYPVALGLLACIVGLMTKRARRREEAEQEARRKSALLEVTLQNMDQGLMMFDEDTRVQICNARAVELLELPQALMASKPRFDEVTKAQFEAGEFTRTDKDVQDWITTSGFERSFHTYERERPDGTVLEIRTVPIQDGGAVRTYTDITERKQVEKRIAQMARHDALTGLANRLLFHESLKVLLDRTARTGETLALLCLDLDHFKTVNDTLGHAFGDELLCEVSTRITGVLRDGDLTARLGGDEFAVLVADTDGAAAGEICDRLVASVSMPYAIAGHQIHIGVSVGLVLAPQDGMDPVQLMKNADLALYRAKADGRGRFRRFEAEMAREVEDRRELEIDLREAVGRGELFLLFQPFLDLTTRSIAGFEALVRWQHPTRGLISPAVFIPIAEETGLIVPLGEWVLRRACEAAALWPEDVTISVNVSAVQFRNASIETTVAAALLATGLSPHRLEIEVTESVLMTNNEACLRTLHLLRNFGVRIAMDDFGTGYSSLSYLRSYPFDKLKIDRSFIMELERDESSAAIVQTIARLAANMGMKTTAEGVETEAQLDKVRAAGCTAVQGYLISKPLRLEDAARLIGIDRRAAAA